MPKILIVDDSSSTRELIRDCLVSIGLNDVLEAEDGQEALDIFKKHQISFIIADCYMPIVDGYTMCKEIFSLTNGKPPPILILTTESNQQIKEKFKQLGVVGWILKPFDDQKVGPVLASLIKKLCP